MGNRTPQTNALHKAMHKAHYTTKAYAKCPRCNKMHTVMVAKEPAMLMRIYCPGCRRIVSNG